MELTNGRPHLEGSAEHRSELESLLIGLEEIYAEPFFAKLRLALSQRSERQRIYEILSAAAGAYPAESSYLIKLREALDRAGQEEFWSWMGRALEEKYASDETLVKLKNMSKISLGLEGQLELLSLLSSPLEKYAVDLRQILRALEHRDKNFTIESLRIFSSSETPAIQLLHQIRKFLEQNSEEPHLQNLLIGLRADPRWEWVHRISVVLNQYGSSFEWTSLSRSQILSKKWLIGEVLGNFGPHLTYIHILCGWYGLLGTLLFLSGEFKNLKIRSYDKDPSCLPIARKFNHPWLIEKGQFMAFKEDIHQLDFGSSRATGILLRDGAGGSYREPVDLLVNTSCEHIENFGQWYEKIPTGTPLALQSNDGFGIAGHTNCVKDLADFKRQAPMSRVLFEGSLNCSLFTRFMLIGYR